MKNAFDLGQSMFFPSFLQSAAAASFLQEAWLSKLSRRRHCFKHSGWLALIMTWRKVLIDIHSCIKGGGRNWLTYLNICLLQTLEKRVKLFSHFIFVVWFRKYYGHFDNSYVYLAMMEHQIIDYWIWMRHLKLMDGKIYIWEIQICCP